jgi:hypothetical protein
MTKFAYEDMSEDQFEKLVVAICRRILGASTSGFAKGKDGGRDARFMGTAELIPSAAGPWVGATIIQAKHTEGLNKSFSDADFFSSTSKSCVVVEEIPNIRRLKDSGKLDHYMIFSNRKLTGLADDAIADRLVKECSIPRGSILLCGLEQIEAWLKDYPEVAEGLGIDPVDYPLNVDPAELAIVVEALATNKQAFEDAASNSFVRVSLADKNRINGMSADYSAALTSRFLKYTDLVKDFLAAPANAKYLAAYEDAATDFQLNVVAKRKDYQSFDDVMNRIRALLFGRDSTLSKNRKVTTLMLFYMYWNCDLGLKVEDAQAV